MLWGWLLILSVGSCVLLGTLVYKSDTPYATPADMRAVTKNFHPLFCAGAKIISPKLTFDAYLIQGKLTTDIVQRQLYESKSAFYVGAQQFYFFAFYLLFDSSVIMRHCPKRFVTFYAFRGQDNFDNWRTDQNCERCYLNKRYLPPSLDCDAFTMIVEEDDDYFLVYSNEHGTGTWIDIHVSQNRSVYDLGHSVPVCSDVLDCEVSIYDLQQTAVYQVNGYYNLDDNSHTVLTTQCVPRIWSYILVHGAIAILLGAVGSVLIHKLCKDQQDSFTLYRDTGEQTPLLNDQLPPSYSSVILTPPKYDDIVKNSDSELPSYADVLCVDTYREGNETIHGRMENVNKQEPYRTNQPNATWFDTSDQYTIVNKSNVEENLASGVRVEYSYNTGNCNNSNTFRSPSSHRYAENAVQDSNHKTNGHLP